MFDKLMGTITSSLKSFKEVILSKKFDAEKAKKYIEDNDIDINSTDVNGDSYLYLAMSYKKTEAAIWLIHNGIETTFKNRNTTALRMAVNDDNTRILRTLLLNTKQNINQIDQNHRTPLQDAIMNGNRQMVKLFIDHKADPNVKDKTNKNAIFDAVAYGDEVIIDYLLDMEDIDLNVKDYKGNTILNNKKVLEDEILVEKFLKKGADPTICDKDGNNLLTYAALKGKDGEYLLDLAIKYGANLNSKVSTNSGTILMEVMHAFTKTSEFEKNRREGLKYIAKKLINNGIDVKAIDKNGETALFEVVRENDVEGCAFLLENKVDINQVNKKKQTALQLAVLQGADSLDIIILLLSYGADPLIKSSDGHTIAEILNYAIGATHNYENIPSVSYEDSIVPNGKYMAVLKELLENSKADFSYLDSNNNPLFFYSFLNDDMKTCQIYLLAGLDINAKNSEGYNLFFAFNLKAFQKGEYSVEYRKYIIYLLANKIDHLAVDKNGQTIYAKIASLKNCNLKLFRKLTEVTRFDYFATDKNGRTIIHLAVLGGNTELMKLVYGVDRNIQDIPDKHNILPITYAALLGHQDMVIEFLRRNVNVTSGKAIPLEVKKKFRPMLKNIVKLHRDVESPDLLKRIEILQRQVIEDFK